ncbi:Endonuclease/exonuclease/phosphatase domain protein, partial [Rhodopirellula sallentina SM41]
MLAALRVATYNVLQGSPNTSTEQGYYSTILEAIGNESKAGVQQPIDLLVLQETNSNSVNSIENILDSLYADDYATYVTPSYSGLAYGFVYNTATLDLLGTQNVSGSFTRPPLRGHFEPVASTTGDADFYVYSAHLKAGSGDASTRASEAAALRADADALGEGENVLIMGDFNMYSSFEGAYSNLTASGAGQVFDPISRPGNWHENNAFKDIHTQDPSGGGGMDDRFDLQFASGELFVSGGLDYVPGSYRAFGNNGTHSLNGTLTGTGAASNVLTALRGASDHLPVVVDYEFDSVPAGITFNETDGDTIVAENSYLDSYSVVLDAYPDADVTVTVTPDAQLDLGAGPGVAVPLVFTQQNYNVPQSLTVMTVDDAVAEGNHISTLVHSFSSTDSAYNSLADVNLDVVIVDDETPTVLINEVDANPSGNKEFVELYDGGIGNTSLTGKTVVLFDGSTDTSYAAFDLDGFTTDDVGLFTIGNSGVNGVDIVFADGSLQNGADAIAIYDGDASSFPNGTPVTTSNLIDAIVYDSDDSDDAGLLALLLSGEPQVNENQNGSLLTQSISRIPDGGDARRTSSYIATTPTPDKLNTPRSVGLTVLGSESIDVIEGGATDSYTIALTSVPSANVVVTIDPDEDLDLGGGQGVPVDLTFTPANAMSPQTVNIVAYDDSFAEGLHNGLITHSIASSDGAYDVLTIDDITATVIDNEAPPPPAMVISEIMYNPASSGEGTSFSPEWVELVNLSTASEDISGWKLRDEDGDWGTIPASTIVQPNQVIVLYDGASTAIASSANFRNAWSIPAGALVVGVDWDQELDNDPSSTEGVLELVDTVGFTRDVVNYDDDDPAATDWPSDSPEGPSIYLTDLLADNNVGSNWARSVVGVDDAVAANGFPFSSSDVGSPGSVPTFSSSITLTVSPSALDEDNAGNILFTFSRTGDTTNALTVNFIDSGTAEFNNDYIETGAANYVGGGTGTVTIPAGQTTASISIDPITDSNVEPDETVVLTIDAGVGYDIGTPDGVSATITNDDSDAEVMLTVGPDSVFEDGTEHLVYTFSRTGDTTNALTVYFNESGTATFNDDYLAYGAATFVGGGSGSITIPAGHSSVTVDVDPVVDTNVESDEEVVLTLEPGVGYTVGTPQAVAGTIANDDSGVTLSIDPTSVIEDGVESLVYTFTRTGAARPILVNFSVNGTATFNNDYIESGANQFIGGGSGNIFIPVFTTTATITIDPYIDSNVESDETVVITLAPGSGYIVETHDPILGTIINDDVSENEVVLAVSQPAVAEDGNEELIYSFTRTGDTTSPLTVNFNESGTATFNADYVQQGASSYIGGGAGSIAIPAGQQSASIAIDPIADFNAEPDETVVLTLASGPGYSIGATVRAIGVITDDDT